MKLIIDGQEVEVAVESLGEKEVEFSLEGTSYRFRRNNAPQGLCSLSNKQEHFLFPYLDGRGVLGGEDVFVGYASSKKAVKKNDEEEQRASPMPGKILKIFVKKGDQVAKGEPLLVMEAMKMEHTIKAPYEGIVAELPYREGDRVEAGVKLVKLER